MNKQKKYGIIYCVANKINNKKYIGQTIQSLNKRKRDHIHSIINNETAFQKAINKYGIDNFIWEIIDYAETQEELDDKEVFWIDYYDTYGSGGYNMTIGGRGNNKATGEKRLSYLSALKDNHPFLIFDKYGNFIEESYNRLLFCLENNIPTNDVNKVLRNKNPSINDYILIFKEDFTEQNLKQRLKRTRYNRNFVVFNERNEYIGTWNNQLKCERDLGFARGCINKCLIGLFKRMHGHSFYYLDECPEELKQLVVN